MGRNEGRHTGTWTPDVPFGVSPRGNTFLSGSLRTRSGSAWDETDHAAVNIAFELFPRARRYGLGQGRRLGTAATSQAL
jgi:hypothetical protein